MNRNLLTLVSFVLLSSVALGQGSKVELRSDSEIRGSIIRLGDVANISDRDRDRQEWLKEVEICLTPNGEEWLEAQFVRERMMLAGVNLNVVEVTGADRVRIQGRPFEKNVTVSAAKASYDQVDLQPSEVDLQPAVQEHVQRFMETNQTDKGLIRQCSVELSDEALNVIGKANSLGNISGLDLNKTGRQTCKIQVHTPNGYCFVPVNVAIQANARAIRVVRNIQSGETIQASDLEVVAVPQKARSDKWITETEAVVGMQAKQQILEGQLLSNYAVKKPTLVKRNETVTVYSIVDGLRIRSTAKALEEGALDQTILLERGKDKKKISGVVRAAGIVTVGE